MVKKLSVALATYNEENNIIDCLESAKKIAQEIIVVDGMSNDKTADLASSFGAKVIKVPNQKMFHTNKNIAIKSCKNEWIFLIDADERITDDLASEIKNLIKNDPEQNGFWVNRKNWFLGGFLNKGGAYPDSVIRLFRKGKGFLPEKNIHEQVVINGSVGHLENDLVHLADPDFARYLERANRYTDLTALDFQTKKVPKNLYNLFFYIIIKPLFTFANIYVRHKGYQDGFRGFAWALFSSSHFFYAYAKYLPNKE